MTDQASIQNSFVPNDPLTSHLAAALKDLRNEVDQMARVAGWLGNGARTRADQVLSLYEARIEGGAG